jgi:dihydrofolate reductase
VSEPRAGSRIEIVLVAALADNGVIGRGGALPWRLKSDMQRLRDITWGKPVVVGRTTFLSFTRKPLPGRTNIVLSRSKSFAAPGTLVASRLDAALEAARGDALRRGVATIIVLGGADVYAQTMPVADRLLITRVHLKADGDTSFPPIDPRVWRETERSEHPAGPDDDASYTTVDYERHATPFESPQGRS